MYSHSAPSAFHAKWINLDCGHGTGACPWARGEFQIPDGTIENAVLGVECTAYFEVNINGAKVGDDVLSPPVSDLRDRRFLIKYDVGKHLRAGEMNCIGIWTSKSWVENPALCAGLELAVDGRQIFFGTDSAWKIRSSNTTHLGGWQWGDFGGERIDARLDNPDWSRAGTNTSKWKDATEVTVPGGVVEHYSGPLNRIGETIQVRTIQPLGEGRHEIDFGTNLTGWFRMDFRNLSKDQVIRMHFADARFSENSSPVNHGSCKVFSKADGGRFFYQTFNQVSEFVSAGTGTERFQNRFNYAGFRYVVIEGMDAAPDPADALAMLVESDLKSAGTFECSDPLLNRIHEINRWTMRCLTLGGYYVDCPHRERMGYGDGQVALQGMMMNFDARAFYTKWAADWRLALRRDSTKLPYIAPPYVETGGGPAWPGNIVLIPWWHYLHYGDTRIITENLPTARAYCEFLDAKSTDDVLRSWGEGFSFIGDWVPPGRGMDTDNWPSREMAELVSNCYRVHLWSLISRMCDAIGRDADAAHARCRASAIRTATHEAFYDASARRYVADEQIYYAFPLLTGVTPAAEREAVHENLLRCIAGKNQGHLDTGMLGTVFLIEYLSQCKRDDLVLEFYQKTTHPGWGHMLAEGATTFWEQWNGYWSQIHSCFTSADNWLYHRLAGIHPDPSQPGFKNVLIEPAFVGNISWVKATHHGPFGLISIKWSRHGRQIHLEAGIPPGSSATLRFPGRPPFQVASGTHQFSATLPSHDTSI